MSDDRESLNDELYERLFLEEDPPGLTQEEVARRSHDRIRVLGPLVVGMVRSYDRRISRLEALIGDWKSKAVMLLYLVGLGIALFRGGHP